VALIKYINFTLSNQNNQVLSRLASNSKNLDHLAGK